MEAELDEVLIDEVEEPPLIADGYNELRACCMVAPATDVEALSPLNPARFFIDEDFCCSICPLVPVTLLF